MWRGKAVVEARRKQHGSSYLHRRDPGQRLVVGGRGDKIPRRFNLLLSTAEVSCSPQRRLSVSLTICRFGAASLVLWKKKVALDVWVMVTIVMQVLHVRENNGEWILCLGWN